MGAGTVLVGVAGMIILFHTNRLSFKKISVGEIILTLKDGWPITGTNLSMNIIQYGNLFILRLFTNDLVAGYFSVAERIYFAVKQMLVIFSQSVYPKACQIAAVGGMELKLFFKKVFRPFFYVVLAGSVALFFLSPLIINFFADEHNDEAIFILRMFCIVLPIICLNIPGTLTLLAYNSRKKYFTVYFSAMLLCIIANIGLVQLFNINGTIAAIFLTELFITIMASIFMYRLLRIRTA